MLCEVLGHEAAGASRVGPRTRRRKANPSVAKTTLSRALETDEAAMTSRGLNDYDEESPTKTIWKDSIRARG